MIDAVAAGHICLDIIPTLQQDGFSFAPGRLVEVGPATIGTGGSVSNTGIALHKLGISTRLMGKIGRDTFGRAVKSIVESVGAGLVQGMIEAEGEITSYSVVISPKRADRMFLHCPGANDTFGAADIDYASLADTRLFHFGYPPLVRKMMLDDGAELEQVFRRAHQTGATTSLDLSMPDPKGLSGSVNWNTILGRTLTWVDVFIPSLDEILFMLYPDKFQAWAASAGACPDPGMLAGIADDLIGLGPALVGFKMGAWGLYLKTASAERWMNAGRACAPPARGWAGRELWSPCFSTTVVGTTGAGDATIAGFLAGLLRKQDLEQCATTACAVGACNVEAADALSGVRGWDETQDRVRAGWPRLALPLPDSWRTSGTGLRIRS